MQTTVTLLNEPIVVTFTVAAEDVDPPFIDDIVLSNGMLFDDLTEYQRRDVLDACWSEAEAYDNAPDVDEEDVRLCKVHEELS